MVRAPRLFRPHRSGHFCQNAPAPHAGGLTPRSQLRPPPSRGATDALAESRFLERLEEALRVAERVLGAARLLTPARRPRAAATAGGVSQHARHQLHHQVCARQHQQGAASAARPLVLCRRAAADARARARFAPPSPSSCGRPRAAGCSRAPKLASSRCGTVRALRGRRAPRDAALKQPRAAGTSFNFETILQAHDTAIRALVWSHNENWLVSGAPLR